jgi:hypothetical protein
MDMDAGQSGPVCWHPDTMEEAPGTPMHQMLEVPIPPIPSNPVESPHTGSAGVSRRYRAEFLTRTAREVQALNAFLLLSISLYPLNSTLVEGEPELAVSNTTHQFQDEVSLLTRTGDQFQCKDDSCFT